MGKRNFVLILITILLSISLVSCTKEDDVKKTLDTNKENITQNINKEKELIELTHRDEAKDEDIDYEINRLFDEVYSEIVTNHEIRSRSSLENFLKNKQGYDIKYTQDFQTYTVEDIKANDGNQVIIILTFDEENIDRVKYYDYSKHIEVFLENQNLDTSNNTEKFLINDTMYYPYAEEVFSIEDQKDFLKNGINELFEKSKEYDRSDNPIELKLELNYEIIDGFLDIEVNTNLPDNTFAFVQLETLDGTPIGHTEIFIENGTSLEAPMITNEGEKLDRGEYKLTFMSGVVESQEDNVFIKAGRNYSNYKGDAVKNNEIRLDKYITIDY